MGYEEETVAISWWREDSQPNPEPSTPNEYSLTCGDLSSEYFDKTNVASIALENYQLVLILFVATND